MTAQSLAEQAALGRSVFRFICALGAALVGMVLLFYYAIPNLLAGPASPLVAASPAAPVMELLVLVAVVGLLSIVGASGYWLEKWWGWWAHLVSVLGQLLFPGALFEFKLDLYHMMAWISPVVSLVILIAMAVSMRWRKRSAHLKARLGR